MEISDFTPSLDLSVVRDDFGFSNIVPQTGNEKSNNLTNTGQNLSFTSQPSNQIGVFPSWTPLTSAAKSTGIIVSSPVTKPDNSSTGLRVNTSYNSTETFFPLTMTSSERGPKCAIDMSACGEVTDMQTLTDLKSPVLVSGPVLNVPSLGHMDLTSAASSSGAYSDGKVRLRFVAYDQTMQENSLLQFFSQVDLANKNSVEFQNGFYIFLNKMASLTLGK
jgi:hypothetical protein